MGWDLGGIFGGPIKWRPFLFSGKSRVPFDKHVYMAKTFATIPSDPNGHSYPSHACAGGHGLTWIMKEAIFHDY
jgi:hypothetical protein